jgi:uncharacterized protein YeaO (DUF488 family)
MAGIRYHHSAMAILIKSIRDPASPDDGARVLVERRPPRGMKTESLALRGWFAALAPSDELRLWFARTPSQWLLFRRRYLAELGSETAIRELAALQDLAGSEPVTTLLTFADEAECSHGAILRELLQGTRKPPASTGPARIAARGRARMRRKP